MIENITYLKSQLVDARDRVTGGLLNTHRNPRQNAWNDVVYAESSVQTSERQQASVEYRIWCAEHGLPYRAIERAKRHTSYFIAVNYVVIEL